MRSGRFAVMAILLISAALIETMIGAAPTSSPTTAPTTAPANERQFSPHEIALPSRGYIELPMHIERGLPVVTLFYDGRPHRFLFDTGVAMMVFRRASDVPKNHRAAPVWEHQMRDGAGVINKSPTTAMRIEQWSFAPTARAETIDFLDFEATQINLPVFSQFKNISGLIGRELFADCAITLDYSHDRLIVHRSTVGSMRRTNETRDPRVSTMPLRVDADGWRIDLEIASKPRTLQIDTCARVGLWMSERAVAGLPLVSADASTHVNTALTETSAQITRLSGDVLLGSFVIREPTILIHGPETDHDLLGAEILQRFTVTFDPPAKRITFRRT